MAKRPTTFRKIGYGIWNQVTNEWELDQCGEPCAYFSIQDADSECMPPDEVVVALEIVYKPAKSKIQKHVRQEVKYYREDTGYAQYS